MEVKRVGGWGGGRGVGCGKEEKKNTDLEWEKKR